MKASRAVRTAGRAGTHLGPVCGAVHGVGFFDPLSLDVRGLGSAGQLHLDWALLAPQPTSEVPGGFLMGEVSVNGVASGPMV